MSDRCKFCSKEFSLQLVPQILSCKCCFCSSCCNYFRSINLQECPFEKHNFDITKISIYEGIVQSLDKSPHYSANKEKAKNCKMRLTETLKNLDEIIELKNKIKQYLPNLSKAQKVIQNPDYFNINPSDMNNVEKLELIRKSKIFGFQGVNDKIITNLATKVQNDFFKTVYSSFLLREKLKFVMTDGMCWVGSSIVCDKVMKTQKILVKIVKKESTIIAGFGIYTGKYKGSSPVFKKLTINLANKLILDYEIQEYSGNFFEIPFGESQWNKALEYSFEFTYDGFESNQKMTTIEFDKSIYQENTVQVRAGKDSQNKGSPLAYIRFSE